MLKPKPNAILLHPEYNGLGPPPATFQAEDIRCPVCNASAGSDCRIDPKDDPLAVARNFAPDRKRIGIHWGRFELWNEQAERFADRGHLGLTFSEALVALKNGQKVERQGWNGRGMWLMLIKEWAHSHPNWTWECAPFIAMKTADDKLVPWLASQTDLLAEDWRVV